MAALDPRFEFQFELGAPTAANLNTAGGFSNLTLSANHWLYVVAGGNVPGSAVAAGRFSVSWPAMHIAMLKVNALDPAILGTHATSRISNLRMLHDAFQRAVAGGMPFTVLGSLDLALAAFVRFARDLAQTNPAAWVLNAASFQVLPTNAAADAALPAEAQWLQSLEFGMAINASSQAVAIAALLSVLPGWSSHVGRAAATLQDCATELYDVVGEQRAGWAAAAPRRHALAISAHVNQRLQFVELVLPVVPSRAFAAASLYRLSKMEAYPAFFEEGWRSAYPSLALLFGAACDGAEALRLTGRLLAVAPSPDPTASLNAQVRPLLPHLDTALLRNASAADRTTRGSRGRRGGGADGGRAGVARVLLFDARGPAAVQV